MYSKNAMTIAASEDAPCNMGGFVTMPRYTAQMCVKLPITPPIRQYVKTRFLLSRTVNIHKPSAIVPATTKAIQGTHVRAHSGNTYEYTVSQKLPIAQAQIPYQTKAAAMTNDHLILRKISSPTRQANNGI